MMVFRNLGLRRLPKAQSLLIAFFLCLIVWQITQHGSPHPVSGSLPVSSRPHAPGTVEVLNSTLGFERIYVINRAARTDRRDFLSLSGAITELNFTFVDGVDGKDVEDRVLPPDSQDHKITLAYRGSWRAHMNVLRSIIEGNLTSALILEDDVDWDVRLKDQLRRFAHASRLFFALGATSAVDEEDKTISLWGLSRRMRTKTTATSYGDNWDVLWLGHCGTDLPDITNSSSDSMSPLRITIPNDGTVPQAEHLRPHPFANPDALGALFPAHTRVVHASNGTVCSTAYAVSQAGARKLLYKFGLKTLTRGWDVLLRDWCDGKYCTQDLQDGEVYSKRPACLTVQPPIFGHWFESKEGSSDIGQQGGGYMKKSGSQYIRLSVKANLGRLVQGAEMHDLVDQWPDSTEVAADGGGEEAEAG